MSIKEVLELGPMQRGGTLLTPELQLAHRNKVLEAGLSIHRDAHVPELLEELAGIIRPDFPEVGISEPRLIDDGQVSLDIEWDFGQRSIYLGPNLPSHNAIRVKAHLLTNDLVVTGGEGSELLEHERWQADQKLVVDAVVWAYKNPLRVGELERL